MERAVFGAPHGRGSGLKGWSFRGLTVRRQTGPVGVWLLVGRLDQSGCVGRLDQSGYVGRLDQSCVGEEAAPE
jgi:hypothetical protein